MELILDAVCQALETVGLRAVRRFPERNLDRTQSVVCVSMKDGKVETSGFGQYLGVSRDPSGQERELYGWKCQAEVLMELYFPVGAERETLFRQVGQAMEALPAGLRPTRITRGDAEPDRASGMMCCPCTLRCTTYMTRKENETGQQWLEFVLRGDVKA